jgi:hypothetical protein
MRAQNGEISATLLRERRKLGSFIRRRVGEDYAHALGLLVLCRILFGGFRGRKGGWGRGSRGRWAAMTAAEREQMLKQRSSHC